MSGQVVKLAPSESAGGKKLDLIRGAAAIARYLGISTRQVYHQAELRASGKPALPIANVEGMGLVASRKTLREHLEAHLGEVEEVAEEP